MQAYGEKRLLKYFLKVVLRLVSVSSQHPMIPAGLGRLLSNKEFSFQAQQLCRGYRTERRCTFGK